MELEIIVLPNPDPIGVQVCDDEGWAPCSGFGIPGCPFLNVSWPPPGSAPPY